MIARLTEAFRGTPIYRNYAGRDPSEQRIILGLTIAVAAVLIWMLIWQPVQNWSESAQQRHERAQGLLEWMQANEQQARDNPPQTRAAGPAEGRLLTVASRTAEQVGLKLASVQQQSAGGVSVVLQKQAFNDVMEWADLLQNTHQVQITTAGVDADNLSGRVNARLSLRR